ncbi:type II toxin-antitoxin system HipA family toxin [Lentisphaera marina]|uniref:type II toxin-antitoxin system HipA family toxin n=1 Tax=Lentisphaera marina TaxID=1111041 RepID=UPI0023655040|nr:type II toxin-antitoxin system HipA family toxin [Lentisphaera marina]MDD7987198.1 type II toxin-antitoxin system HipA family toxin [Lentisphaera marina]
MKKLEVYYQQSESDSRLIGTLAEQDRKIYFEYASDFLSEPLWLSPFKLAPKSGLYEFKDYDFGQVFGLFDDSLPDGWGLLLMDRMFRKQGLNPNHLSILDRLAYLGSRTMGALSYRPCSQSEDVLREVLDLQIMADEVEKVWQGSLSDVLPQLLHHGGSPGGARPKVLAGIKGDEIITADILPDGFEAWILKFIAPNEHNDSGKLEYVYSQMARKSGLRMPETRLYKSADESYYFGIKRFDRKAGKRVHIHTFGNLIHCNYRIPSSDYLDLLKVTRVLTKNQEDVEQVFRQAVFNIASHNRDDHVKNFSFIYDKEWSAAPAYDLTFNSGPGGEHSMSLCGEGKNPTGQGLVKLAEKSGISVKQVKSTIEEVSESLNQFSSLAKEYEIEAKEIQMIDKHIQANLKRLRL